MSGVYKGEPDPTDLDFMLALFQGFNIEYTLIQDEAGATVELAVGNRGVIGTWGHIAIFNFAPPERDEKFLYAGVGKLV